MLRPWRKSGGSQQDQAASPPPTMKLKLVVKAKSAIAEVLRTNVQHGYMRPVAQTTTNLCTRVEPDKNWVVAVLIS